MAPHLFSPTINSCKAVRPGPRQPLPPSVAAVSQVGFWRRPGNRARIGAASCIALASSSEPPAARTIGGSPMSAPSPAKRVRGEDGQSIFTRHAVCCVLDYGSQYTQLIARRIRDSGVLSVLMPGDVTMVGGGRACMTIWRPLPPPDRRRRLHLPEPPPASAWSLVTSLPNPGIAAPPNRSASRAPSPRPSSFQAGPTLCTLRGLPACQTASGSTAPRMTSRYWASATACRWGPACVRRSCCAASRSEAAPVAGCTQQCAVGWPV